MRTTEPTLTVNGRAHGPAAKVVRQAALESFTEGPIVVLAVDGSEQSEAAIDLAISLPWPKHTSICVMATATEAGANNVTIQDSRAGGQSLDDWSAAQRLVREAANRLDDGQLTVSTQVLQGPPAGAIRQVCRELAADLVVIGAAAYGRSGEFQMSSTASDLIESAPCSLLLARPGRHNRPLSLVIAADGSAESKRAAAFLDSFRLPQRGEIAVVCIAEPYVPLPGGGHFVMHYEMPDYVRHALLSAAEACAAKLTVQLRHCVARVTSVVQLGNPAVQLISIAQERDADLLILGLSRAAHDGSAQQRQLAQFVSKQAACSVLLAR